MQLTHLSLCTGAGGIDIAAEQAGFQTVGQCEINDYAYRVLCKNFPNVKKWRDIKDVTIESFRERIGGGRDVPTIISAGFPCQPHSLAGKRFASDDERDLWGEVARILCEIKPRWFVGENVVGLLTSENGRFFGRVLRDLDEIGYHAAWGVWGACDVGAIHRRKRIFIIANSDSVRRSGMDKSKQEQCIRIIKEKFNNTKVETRLDVEQINILRDGNRALFKYGGESRRNDDGLSTGIHRLECIGNAVMPAQIYPIFNAIAQIESSYSMMISDKKDGAE